MGRRWSACFSVAAMLTVGGCGDGDTDACGDFAGCGGDVVGEWKADSVCGSGSIAIENCSAKVPMDLSGLTTSGSMTFNADRTYRSTMAFGGSMTMHWPKACLTIMGVTLTCAQLNAALNEAMMAEPDPDIASIICSDESQGCACKATFRTSSAAETGRYSLSGNAITTTPDGPGSAPETSQYCVQGQTLKVQFLPVDMNDDLRGGMTLKK